MVRSGQSRCGLGVIFTATDLPEDVFDRLEGGLRLAPELTTVIPASLGHRTGHSADPRPVNIKHWSACIQRSHSANQYLI